MFIFKNAIRCILRSKGRSVLLGIISLVITVSACLGLSIRQAAESAKAETLAGMSVTATISFDRQSMMGNMERPHSYLCFPVWRIQTAVRFSITAKM